MGSMPRVAIVASTLVGESIAHALDAAEGMAGATAVPTVPELAEIVASVRPDVVVVALSEAALNEGATVQGLAALRERNLPIVFLAQQDDPPSLETALRRGASGFLLMSISLSTLASAIRIVAGGGTVLDGGARRGEGRLAGPSERELELLRALSRGLTNLSAAHELGISPRTVESHLRRLFLRYGTYNRSQLLMLAVREGWITTRETAQADEAPEAGQSTAHRANRAPEAAGQPTLSMMSVFSPQSRSHGRGLQGSERIDWRR